MAENQTGELSINPILPPAPTTQRALQRRDQSLLSEPTDLFRVHVDSTLLEGCSIHIADMGSGAISVLDGICRSTGRNERISKQTLHDPCAKKKRAHWTIARPKHPWLESIANWSSHGAGRGRRAICFMPVIELQSQTPKPARNKNEIGKRRYSWLTGGRFS